MNDEDFIYRLVALFSEFWQWRYSYAERTDGAFIAASRRCGRYYVIVLDRDRERGLDLLRRELVSRNKEALA